MQSVSDTRRHTVNIRLPLSRLRPGETGCVVCIDPASPLLERLGDFGFVWDGSKEEQKKLDWLRKRPYTLLFLDGSHENYDLLAQYP